MLPGITIITATADAPHNSPRPPMSEFRDRPVEAYGVGRLNSLGQRPIALWSGSPSVSAGDFRLELSNGMPGQGGVVHVGVTAAQTPFMGGTLLASLPLARAGTYRVDDDGHATVDIVPGTSDVGTTRYFQFLFRDPGQPAGAGVAMSNGVRVRFLP
ncbi:MAG: hypothetical protein DRQ65_06045 [Gammaproteobacteria bacterium]|nr:MAG: hypothetical protein DRQ65_06045 [Gammaproteobacteria bacterium]